MAIRSASHATNAKSLRVGLGAAVVLVIIALAVAVVASALGSQSATESLPASSATLSPISPISPSDTRSAASNAATTSIFVHVVGAVVKPGLYSLNVGNRVVDAISAAGGFAKNADRAQVNLARIMSDGEQLDVPILGAEPTAPRAARIRGGKVNLNTADAAALESLPQIGPAMAQRIIDWRSSHGRFSSASELMSISGIGNKTFHQLKPLVTV